MKYSRKLDDLHEAVRIRYQNIITRTRSESSRQASCCEREETFTRNEKARILGYSTQDLTTVPQNTNLGLGCGNPTAIAALQRGETILDLGSGAGFDCFLAARAVGETGTVIGIDMTYEMLHHAKTNAKIGGFQNVFFQLGQIEYLPLLSQSVDVILSNCVINLCPNKSQVFREAFRVLKRGGRLAISDIVATADLPDAIRNNVALKTCCVAGATMIDDMEAMLTESGFTNIQIQQKNASKTVIREWIPEIPLEHYLVSANIGAMKPS